MGEMMSSSQPENASDFCVVFNEAQQYSLWPVGIELPSGWHLEGRSGNKEECLSHIKSIWKQMAPAKLQPGSTMPGFSYESLLHELIGTLADQFPDSTAIVFENQQLTYRELTERSRRVAQCLKQLGIQPESPVCIFMDQSPELVIAILGILQAGGVCVPLDPAYPEDHLDFILGDTAASIVLLQEKFIERLSKKDVRTLTLSQAYEIESSQVASLRQIEITSENLAFIFYTSGSTGRPKGVMLSHRAIHSHNAWRRTVYNLSREDRHLFRCPLGFAFLLTEVLLPLLTGARIVIALPEKRDDTAYLLQLISRNRITIVNFVPSQIRMILEEQNVDPCASIRHWVTGGEALPVELQKKFYARFTATLSIIYGSTEARSSTLWLCPEQQEEDTITPIGRAAPGKQVFLLDSNLRPVSPGEIGELYIGGEGIARGYLNRPDLTAEKFVPNPFSGSPGDRLYRTGDLARYQSDQTLEFLGRSDQQVKVRGFRIELGQIEAAITEHPDVREAVALCNEDHSGIKQLVAYVVSRHAIASSTLQNWLKQKIPAYMVPSLILVLPMIPRTAHGKVDVQMLTSMATRRRFVVNARNETEQSLMMIWQQVFGSNQIGVEDDFFELGGDSLLATQIISRIRETLHVNLPFNMFFEHATVARLGRLLQEQFLTS